MYGYYPREPYLLSETIAIPTTNMEKSTIIRIVHHCHLKHGGATLHSPKNALLILSPEFESYTKMKA
jgi:hypothetical protein